MSKKRVKKPQVTEVNFTEDQEATEQIETEAKTETDAKKAEKRAAKKAAREKKNEELKAVLEFAIEKATEFGLDNIGILAAKYMPGAKTAGTGGAKKASLKEFFEDLFGDKKWVSEDDVFARFKLGRAEMRKKCLQAIKKAAPADRIWVRLDYTDGGYHLAGKGEVPPADWTGYKPLVVEGEEIK